ncbi:MAG: hypothetical protein JWQ79_3652 [Mucilaginibacter sp.]|nr:hypothetical protein [Mucilaginibacter sp.]
MKSKLTYLLPLSILVIMAVGCIKKGTDPSTDLSNYPYPLGTFNGRFLRIRFNPVTSKKDTTSVALQLILSTSIGYTVTGDTSTIHAGSYGSFSENNVNIAFNDFTYPANGRPTKTHLSGVYNYTLTGTAFQITGSDADSTNISYVYNFTKVSN